MRKRFKRPSCPVPLSSQCMILMKAGTNTVPLKCLQICGVLISYRWSLHLAPSVTSQLTTVASESYVYWTVHRLDSWLKRDQLDVTCFIISLFNAQHVSDVNTSILRSLRLICWVISWVVLLWFGVCWCYVVVRLWWCGIRMQASACIRIPQDDARPNKYKNIRQKNWLDDYCFSFFFFTFCGPCIVIYRVIRNDCRGFNNLSYTTHLR